MAQASASTRTYEDFQPLSNWERKEESDTLLINLPGFKKENFKIQTDRHGQLSVTGECPLTESKWSRFSTKFMVPENCIDNDIKAEFANGVLRVTMPKTVTRVAPKDEAMSKQEATPDQGQTNKEDAENEMNGIDGKLAGEGEGNSAGKMKTASNKENQVLDPQKQSISYRFGMGTSIRFKQPKRTVLSVAVGIAVVVAFGVYAKYRHQHSVETEG